MMGAAEVRVMVSWALLGKLMAKSPGVAGQIIVAYGIIIKQDLLQFAAQSLLFDKEWLLVYPKLSGNSPLRILAFWARKISKLSKNYRRSNTPYLSLLSDKSCQITLRKLILKHLAP